MATAGQVATSTSGSSTAIPKSAQAAPPSLPEYGWAYFDHVRAEYDTLDDSAHDRLPSQVKTILQSLPHSAPAPSPHLLALMGFVVVLWLLFGLWRLSQNPPGNYILIWLAAGAAMYLLWIVGSVLAPLYEKRTPCPTWGDLYVLEYWLVDMLPFERLRVKAWDWRDRYHQIAGDRRYQEYLKSQAYVEPVPPAPPPPNAEALLRADLKTLVGELHRFYSLTAKLERKRTQMSQLSGACLSILLFATLGVLAISFKQRQQNPTAPSKPVQTISTKSTRVAPAAVPTATSAAKTPTASPATPAQATPAISSGATGKRATEKPPVKGAVSLVPTILLAQASATARPDPTAQSTLSGQAGNRKTDTDTAIVGGASSASSASAPSASAPQSVPSTAGGTDKSGSISKPSVGQAQAEQKKNGNISSPIEVPLLAMVVVMGTIGGFISMQRRLQSLSSESDPFVSLMGLERGGAVLVLLSTLSGAVFAVLLTLVFVGNFISGDLFPEFVVPWNDKTGVSFWTFLTTIQTVSGIDVAKMLVWAFIAGFAEQFVPDVLNRIVNAKTS